MSKLEFLVAAVFLLGPMVYALTLPSEGAGQCEASVVVVELTGECSAPVVEPEPPPASEPTPTDEPSAGPLAFAFVVGEGRYVVLADDVDASWGTGEFFEPAGEAERRVGKRADLDRVDADHRAQIGRTFDIYDEFGKECSAKIERLLVIAQYDWGFEGLELEERSDPETGETIEPELETIRAAVWTTQSRWLVGELDDDCGSLWARDAALPAPTILTYSTEPSPTLRARLARFESEELPALREDYEAFRAEHDDPEDPFPAWDVRMAEHEPHVGAWLDAVGVPHFVELGYGFDDSVCGFGHPSRLETFEAIEGGRFKSTGSGVDVTAIFDVDLDGRFELLYVDPDEYLPAQAWALALESATEGLSSVIAVGHDHSGCEC